MAQGYFKTFEREDTRTPKLNGLKDQVDLLNLRFAVRDAIANSADPTVNAILDVLRQAGLIAGE